VRCGAVRWRAAVSKMHTNTSKLTTTITMSDRDRECECAEESEQALNLLDLMHAGFVDDLFACIQRPLVRAADVATEPYVHSLVSRLNMLISSAKCSLTARKLLEIANCLHETTTAAPAAASVTAPAEATTAAPASAAPFRVVRIPNCFRYADVEYATAFVKRAIANGDAPAGLIDAAGNLHPQAKAILFSPSYCWTPQEEAEAELNQLLKAQEIFEGKYNSTKFSARHDIHDLECELRFETTFLPLPCPPAVNRGKVYFAHEQGLRLATISSMDPEEAIHIYEQVVIRIPNSVTYTSLVPKYVEAAVARIPQLHACAQEAADTIVANMALVKPYDGPFFRPTELALHEIKVANGLQPSAHALVSSFCVYGPVRIRVEVVGASLLGAQNCSSV
jgi:hypothetical protein